MNRREFIALASGLLVPREPERVYSFLWDNPLGRRAQAQQFIHDAIIGHRRDDANTHWLPLGWITRDGVRAEPVRINGQVISVRNGEQWGFEPHPQLVGAGSITLNIMQSIKSPLNLKIMKL